MAWWRVSSDKAAATSPDRRARLVTLAAASLAAVVAVAVGEQQRASLGVSAEVLSSCTASSDAGEVPVEPACTAQPQVRTGRATTLPSSSNVQVQQPDARVTSYEY